jgi:hypothetical protein
MAITASGFYGLSLEKCLIDTLGESLEAEDHKMALVNDTYAPNFDTHDFHADLTNEIANGGGYTTGGTAFTTTEVTLSSGTLTWDFADVSWTSSTIASAMAGVCITNVGSSATDQLLLLLDFVTAVSTTSGTLLVTIAGTGAMTIDYTP